MFRFIKAFSLLMILSNVLPAQDAFTYKISITPVNFPSMPGIHSYAVAQHAGKWLIIGGRKDGLHARQPFASFPAASNNTDIYVVDIKNLTYWSASINTLPAGLKEHLQTTNANFFQDADTLYYLGGYAYSASANDHITFPKLTSINVSGLISAIINGTTITPYFKQISDPLFAVAGGQMGKIGDEFYLVGGHQFDGRYNAMGQPTYTQKYTNAIRKFQFNNSVQLSYSNYSQITDSLHLHRRDYNLIPQIFPDRTYGYTISAGVFQPAVNLPFLYPVDISGQGYTPNTTFSQYLSHYHGAKAALYDSLNNQMHSLFFGGLSQYYYQNGILVQDNLVPFVKTISRLSRNASGTLTEYVLPLEMPAFKGTGAEFIPADSVPFFKNGIINLNDLIGDTTLIGYIFGGILSPSLNPFTNNQTTSTAADNTILEVRLIKSTGTGFEKIKNPDSFTLYPNPLTDNTTLRAFLATDANISYKIFNPDGKLIKYEKLPQGVIGMNNFTISTMHLNKGIYYLQVFNDNTYVSTLKFIKQ